MTNSLPPGLVLMLGALVLPWLPERTRSVLLLGLPVLTLFVIWSIPDGDLVDAASTAIRLSMTPFGGGGSERGSGVGIEMHAPTPLSAAFSPDGA